MPQWILRPEASEVLVLEVEAPVTPRHSAPLTYTLYPSRLQLLSVPQRSPSLCSYSPFCLDSPSFFLPFYLLSKHLSSFKTQLKDHFIHVRIRSFIQPAVVKIHHMPGCILVTGKPKSEQYMVPILKKLTI